MNERSTSFLSPTTRSRLLNPVPGTFAEIKVVSPAGGDDRTLAIPPEILLRIMTVLRHTGNIKTLHHLAFTSTTTLSLGADLIYDRVLLGNKTVQHHVRGKLPGKRPRKPRHLTSWTLAAAELGWIRELEFGVLAPSWTEWRGLLLDTAIASGRLRHVVTRTAEQAERVWTTFARSPSGPHKSLAKWTFKNYKNENFGWLKSDDNLSVERVELSLDEDYWSLRSFRHGIVGMMPFLAALARSSGVSTVDASKDILRRFEKCRDKFVGQWDDWSLNLGWARFGMSYFTEIFEEDGVKFRKTSQGRTWKWARRSELLRRVDLGLFHSLDFIQALDLLPHAEQISIGCVMSCNIGYDPLDAVSILRDCILVRKKLHTIKVHFASCREDTEIPEVWKPLATLLKADGIEMSVECGSRWPELS